MPPAVTPARKLTARLDQAFIADGKSFVTRPVAELDVTLEGIPGDRHTGFTRPADARVPWYPRGAPIHNERHLSAVAPDDLTAVAEELSIPAIDPTWLGANLLVSGLNDFSFLPRGTRLVFPSGAALAVADQNVPCRGPGKVVSSHHPDHTPLDFAFVKAAKRRRGIVLWVERAGRIVTGDPVEVRIPEQWVYGG